VGTIKHDWDQLMSRRRTSAGIRQGQRTRSKSTATGRSLRFCSFGPQNLWRLTCRFSPAHQGRRQQVVRPIVGIRSIDRKSLAEKVGDGIISDPGIAAKYKRAPARKSCTTPISAVLLEHVISLCGLANKSPHTIPSLTLICC